MNLASRIRDRLRAKRSSEGAFWKTLFSTKDAIGVFLRRRARLRRRKANLLSELDSYRRNRPRRRPRWEEFHLRSAVLRTQSEYMAAIREVQSLGLEPHQSTDRKNWDSLAALSAILKTTEPDARVLDGGASLLSKILPWLSAYGYKNLIGIDLSFRSKIRIGNIRYQHGDLTRTEFPNGYFDAVACISVIEHGVDIQLYFREMSRIIKPNGLLITSTDYWPDHIDTRGMETFDAPWRISDRGDMRGAIETAENCGFELDGKIELDARERTVAWNRREYTFIYFALRNAKDSGPSQRERPPGFAGAAPRV